MNEFTQQNPKGIIAKVDLLGRIVIPSQWRKQLDIDKGDEVEFFCYDDGVFIKVIKEDK